MDDLRSYLPARLNKGRWITAYTLNQLQARLRYHRVVLPICSLGAPVRELTELARYVLPPLYHEAFADDDSLKQQIIERIRECFPYLSGTMKRDEIPHEVDIVELPARSFPAPPSPQVLGCSADTAVNQHGPHLPLASDSVQSYSILQQLAAERPGFVLGPPVEYGLSPWGLPFGMSIDITPDLLMRYVRGFADAIQRWAAPQSVYVVSVQESEGHRQAVEQGFQQSRIKSWKFRWLYEPLIEFTDGGDDLHAGGVETTLIGQLNPDLLDGNWWPDATDALTMLQFPVARASEISDDPHRFSTLLDSQPFNGIIGDIRNAASLDPRELLNRMLDLARYDLRRLINSEAD